MTTLNATQQTALQALREGAELVADVAWGTDQTLSNARRTLKKLVELGLAVYYGNDMYGTNEFAIQFAAAKSEGKSKCAALRAVAHAWQYSRKEYIDGAALCGVKQATASANWAAMTRGEW